MKFTKYILLFFLAVSAKNSLLAQRLSGGNSPSDTKSANQVSLQGDLEKIYYHCVVPDVIITAQRPTNRSKRKYARAKKQFDRLKYRVLKVYPYAREIAKNVGMIEEEIIQIKDPKAISLYLKSREKFLFGKYEEEIKNLSIGQGKILIKLIDREVENSAYSLIKNYKNGVSAFGWQAVGSLFGLNLKTEYNPVEEHAIEMIVRQIEKGKLPTYEEYLASFR